jgi:ArsR family transcriptional regulator
MKCKACSEVEFFKALGDKTRYKIITTLLECERCACELPKIVKRAQPTVSLQLKYLSKLGILSSRRESKKIIYSVVDDRIINIFKILGHKKIFLRKIS